MLKNIEKVLDILKDYNSNIIVIFSAIGKTTDKLIECGKLASKRDSNYKTLFQSLLDEHLKICSSLFEIKNQSEILSFVQKKFNELDSIFWMEFLILRSLVQKHIIIFPVLENYYHIKLLEKFRKKRI